MIRPGNLFVIDEAEIVILKVLRCLSLVSMFLEVSRGVHTCVFYDITGVGNVPVQVFFPICT